MGTSNSLLLFEFQMRTCAEVKSPGAVFKRNFTAVPPGTAPPGLR
jgi:hypothetical protein